MKKMRILVLLLLVTTSLSAQNGNNQTLKSNDLSLDEKSWMRDTGFPITKYNFNSRNINDELRLGLKERKDAKLLSTASWIGLGAGLITSIAGSTKGGTGVYIAGGGLMIGGLVTSIFARSKKEKARKRIQNASYLFDDLK